MAFLSLQVRVSDSRPGGKGNFETEVWGKDHIASILRNYAVIYSLEWNYAFKV